MYNSEVVSIAIFFIYFVFSFLTLCCAVFLNNRKTHRRENFDSRDNL